MGGVQTHSRFIIWINEKKKEGEGETQKVRFAVQDNEKGERETGMYKTDEGKD